MTKTPQKNFLGIPIVGDIQHNKPPVQQRPLAALAPLMQALLDDASIAWFGWRQYTPYFNDGEPCVFNVHGALAVMLDDAEIDPPAVTECQKCGETVDANVQEYCAKCGRAVPTLEDIRDEMMDSMYDGVECSGHLGQREKVHENGKWVTKSYTGPDEDRFNRCLALEEALDSGAFDSVLLEHFGDHATVRVSRDGIVVEEYSHD
jgi:hypothetical protein